MQMSVTSDSTQKSDRWAWGVYECFYLTCTGRFMELDAVLWSRLPFEMVERVLSFLPVPNLCRYRRVCKTWDRLIRSPEFGAICVQSAAKRDALFITMRCPLGSLHKTPPAWFFLDLDTRQWYKIKEMPQKDPCWWVAAMDGGLICRHSKPWRYVNPNLVLQEAQYFSIIVYNPIAKTMKKTLPSVQGHAKSKDYASLNLVVDNITQQFKVFLINQHVCASSAASSNVQIDPLMRIYDSTTNEWKSSTDPFCVSSRGVGSVSSTVILQGFLYALFGPCRGRFKRFVEPCEIIEEEIWRYNIGDDVWEKVDVNIAGMSYSTQLFASANRLFRVGWVLDKSRTSDEEQWRLEVSEIKLPAMVQESLFVMSKTDAVKFFDANLFRARSPGNPEIVASGYVANSILLICKLSQKMMVLDLKTRLWDQLPTSPWWPRPGNHFEDYIADPVSHMNLSLPSSSVWCQEGAIDQAQLDYPQLS